jgi:hypothetical protein
VTRRPGRWAACFAVGFASLLLAAPAAAQSPDVENLVRAYAPIVMLRAQDPNDLCKTSQEQYNPPTTVDAVLGNAAVRLMHHVGDDDVLVKRAPTAADVAGLDEDYYLDLPRDTLHPGCGYAEDFSKLKENSRAPPTTYAHIATQPGHSGLVVQYFFFYYFNQFNDIHEGDWEGMQIAFDADTPGEAFEQGPSEIALFQHAGGERGSWDDTKVEKDGTHPIVYSAAGSHATFYDSATFVENGSHGSGVGCDNTSEPLTRTEPQPVVVPTHGPPGSKYQWLSYLGRWGQREKAFNNGPQGPVTKSQWLRPFDWMADIRQSSPQLPGGSVLGPGATAPFCWAMAEASKFINLEAKTTLGAIGLALALILLVTVPPFFTRWRPVDLTKLRHRWSVGQLLRGSRQLYGRHWRVFLSIALIGFVILAAIQGVQYLFEQLTGSTDYTLRFEPGGLDLRYDGSLTGFGQPIGFAVVSGAVVAFLRMREDEGERPGVREAFAAMYQRLWRVVIGQLLVVVLVFAMIFTVIGIPFALYFYIAWQFIQQEIMFKNCSIREAYGGSHALVRGHWWRTILIAGSLSLVAVATGPVLGIFLIFLNFSPVTVNLIGSVVFALLIPYVAIGRTLLYFDLGARDEERAGEPKRRPRLRWPRAAASESN